MPKALKRKRKSRVDVDFEEVRSGIRGAGTLQNGLFRFRTTTSPTKLLTFAGKIARHPAYKGIVYPSPFPKKMTDIPAHGFRTLTGYHREIAWAGSVVESFSSEINEFLEYRKYVEEAFVSGNLSKFPGLMKEIESKFGISLWYIENTINYLQITDGTSAKNRYVRLNDAETASSMMRYLVSWMSYKASADVSKSAFDKLLDEAVSLDYGYPYMVHLLNGRRPVITQEVAGEIISYSDSFPVIDRYEILLLVLQNLLSSGSAEKDIGIAVDAIRLLSRSIKDPRLSRLVVSMTSDLVSFDIDEVLIGSLDLYTVGDYEAIDTDKVNSIEIANTIVRSEIISGGKNGLHQLSESKGELAAEIFADLRLIQSFDEGAQDARSRLQKVALMFCNSGWASSLALVLARQTNDERVFAPAGDQIVHALRASLDHPLLAFSLPSTDATQRYLTSLSQSAPESATVKALSKIAAVAGAGDWPEGLSEERQIRFDALRKARAGLIHDAVNDLQTIEVTAGPVAARESKLLLVHLLLALDRVAEAADIAGHEFVQSRYFGAILPISRLVDALLLTHNQPMTVSPTRGRLSVAIVFDIFSRYVSPAHDAERADAFKDVLKVAGLTHASSLAANSTGLPLDDLVYFLRYICVPDVLDQSLALQTSRAVEDERAAILVAVSELMASRGRTSPAALKEELRDIRTRQVVRDTKLRLDQSKIYVNVDAIRRSIDVEMRENWNRYQLMLASDGEDIFTDLHRIVRSTFGDKVTIVSLSAPLSERRSLFGRMIAELRDQFTMNKEFGLNSNLSANIRHGYVLKELRGPLVARHLISNKDSESGTYHANMFWRERLHEWDDTTELDSALNSFAEKVDSLIDRINRQLLRIKSENSPDGLFNYDIAERLLNIIEDRWSGITSYDDFIEAVFKSFWETTDRNLSQVRRKLADEILPELIELINGLENEIARIGFESKLPGISSSLTLVKPEMRDAMVRVASWFTLSGNNEYQDFDLEIAYQAAFQAIKTYYRNLDIRQNYKTNEPKIMMGWCLPMFTRLFFLILDNAAMHGGEGRSSLVLNTEVEITDGLLFIRVKNDLGASHDMERLDATVSKINDEYGQATAIEFVAEEGGSGYPKIWKILKTDLNRNHLLTVSSLANDFTVEISMHTDGIVK